MPEGPWQVGRRRMTRGYEVTGKSPDVLRLRIPQAR